MPPHKEEPPLNRVHKPLQREVTPRIRGFKRESENCATKTPQNRG